MHTKAFKVNGVSVCSTDFPQTRYELPPVVPTGFVPFIVHVNAQKSGMGSRYPFE